MTCRILQLAGQALAVAVVLCPGEAWAETYYVATDGSNSATGSVSAPWLTLQWAADTIAPGDTVIVADGDYAERVAIDQGGSAESLRVTFRSETPHGAKLIGFVVRGDYVTIEGFEIEASASSGRGVFVDGADYAEVLGCYVHECPSGGIDVSGASAASLPSYARVVDNHLEHNGQWGVHVVGSHVLVEANEVWKTVQHHPKLPFTGFHGEDADGLRIFGDHHTIRRNYIHDLGNVEDPGNHVASTEYPDDFPHVDCLQTWDRSTHGGRPVMSDSVIEQNHCRVSRASGKGVIITAVDAPARNIVIRNNIFEYRDIGVSATIGTFENLSIYNNLFRAAILDNPWGAAVSLANVTGFRVVNNIMIDGHAQVRKIAGSGEVDYNLAWWSNGSMPQGEPGAQPNELWGVDPQFNTFSDQHGGDYHLAANSPALGAGIGVAELVDDFDGMPRPAQGVAIGPYEYRDPSLPDPPGPGPGSGSAGSAGASSGGSGSGGAATAGTHAGGASNGGVSGGRTGQGGAAQGGSGGTSSAGTGSAGGPGTVGGSGGATATPGANSSEDSGCGCSVAKRSNAPAPIGVAALLGLLFCRLRRSSSRRR